MENIPTDSTDALVAVQAFLQGALHAVAQVALYPVIALLLIMIAYALFSIGSIVVELIREKRHFKVVIPRFLRSIKETPLNQVPSAVAQSGLLGSQQEVLLTIFANRDLDDEGLWALAKKLLVQERDHRQKVVSRNDAMSKLAPMVGLMGTLIPLGPGIVAFGQGNGAVMAQAMLVAFDTTVAGLITAAIMFVISRVRRRWYANYDSSLEAAATTLLERIEKMTAEDREAAQTGDVQQEETSCADAKDNESAPRLFGEGGE